MISDVPVSVNGKDRCLCSPSIPISTAGSLEGICCRKGRISSMTNHLSRYSRIFPRHTNELTRTFTAKKEKAQKQSYCFFYQCLRGVTAV